MGKAVARGSKKAVVKECIKDPVMQKYVVEVLGLHMRQELASLCSNSANSVLQDPSLDALCEFSWAKLHKELQTNAPTFLHFLEICTNTRKPRCNRAGVIGMCAALLLKHRFPKMSLVQKINSLLLYASHSGKQVFRLWREKLFILFIKQVFQRLQKLNICMSHQSTITLVKQLGSNHDAKVVEWRDDMLQDAEVIHVVVATTKQYYPLIIGRAEPITCDSS